MRRVETSGRSDPRSLFKLCMMKFPKRAMLGAGFGLFATMLAANLLASIFALWRLEANDSTVLGSAQHLRQLEATLSTIKDAESGQRGYLLTGEERYLRPYLESVDKRGEDLARLRESSEGPEERAGIDGLEGVVSDKFRELEDTVTLHRTGRLGAAREVVKSGLGIRLMGDIRDRFRSLADRARD